jgi:para-aminobenzoate synthetase/4-amino-4-deoxychorismate lyase
VNRCTFHDSTTGQWLTFQNPVETVVATSPATVLPALERLETLVNTRHLHAAGFIGYEAAPAFDPSLKVRPDPSGFPLLWFGLYEAPEKQTALPAPAPHPSSAPTRWTPSISPDQYRDAMARLHTYLYSGDTYQVNYSFRLQAPFTDEPWAFFCNLVHAQKAHHAAFVENDRFALCSASPEQFFKLDGNHITARPMKGTARRGCTPEEDERCAEALLQSPKDRAENVMIVDMIRNDLGRIATPGSVQPSALFTLERYPTAWQMTSTVSAHTNASVRDILTALFPCASITGAPKSRTMAIIAELETTPRRIYTGAIGFIAPHRQARFNVAIRTVLIDKSAGTAEYGVGGGIVWDSTSQSEYEECRTKARILTDPRPEFHLLETLLWTPAEGFFLLDRHLQRLIGSAGYFDYRASDPAIGAALQSWADTRPDGPHRLRLLVARDGAVTLQAQPFQAQSDTPVKVALAPSPVDPSDPFLFHKTTHRQIYEQARSSCPDCEDVLLWNPGGELTESTIANLVLDLDGDLVTPPVACGLLPGTFRAALLAEGRIHEKVVRVADLQRCRHLWLINSVRKWRTAVLTGQPAV